VFTIGIGSSAAVHSRELRAESVELPLALPQRWILDERHRGGRSRKAAAPLENLVVRQVPNAEKLLTLMRIHFPPQVATGGLTQRERFHRHRGTRHRTRPCAGCVSRSGTCPSARISIRALHRERPSPRFAPCKSPLLYDGYFRVRRSTTRAAAETPPGTATRIPLHSCRGVQLARFSDRRRRPSRGHTRSFP